MKLKEVRLEITLVLLLLVSLLLIFAVIAVTISLINPTNNLGFTTTNSISFNCSVNDTDLIKNITLYHDINGSFSANSTKHFGLDNEIISQKEVGQVLLFHFNNDSAAGENSSFVYDWSGNGNNGNIINVDHNATGGRFSGGFEFKRQIDLGSPTNESISIANSNSLNLSTGTLEAWVKFNIPSGVTKEWPILIKGDAGYETSSYMLDIYSDSSNCRAEVYIGNGINSIQVASSSLINCSNQQWHHIAGTWNGTELRIYLDGVLNGTTTQTINSYYTSGVLRIGAATALSLEFNGTIDEIAIYNRSISEMEIAIHAGLKPNNFSQVWTLNVNDGRYKWNCKSYDNISEGNWSSSNNSFYVDVNPPSVSSVRTDPFTDDAIDPGTTVNILVNISEKFGVTAILQYKLSGAGVWTNKSMVNASTEIYEANFTATPSGAWNYRIFVNDSNNHSNFSNQYNFTAEYEYTWLRSPADFEIVSGLLDSTKSIGILTINNTGDANITFDLINNAPNGMSYNVTEPFTLAINQVKMINVSATYSSIIREDIVIITINATDNYAVPAKETTNVTLASYAGGPYFNVKITNHSSTINQSRTMVLSAYVSNIGNDTSTQTWLNWTLPNGWTNISGNLSFFIGNLSIGTTVYNNITANITSSASAGAATIIAIATSQNNVSDNDTKSITVSCYSGDNVCGSGCSTKIDSDCTAEIITVTTGGGGSGGGGGVSGGSAKKEEVVISKQIHIIRGQKGNFTIDIENQFKNSSIENLTVNLAGFMSQYITTSPDILDGISYGNTKSFYVDVFVPGYLKYSNYTLKAIITGLVTENIGNISKQRLLTISNYIQLIVHEISNEEAVAKLANASVILFRMNESGFVTTKNIKLFKIAQEYLKNKEYESAHDLAEKIIVAGNKAFFISSQIEELKQSIINAENSRLDVGETKTLLNLAIAAFEREDFETAEKRIKEAQVSIMLETRGVINIVGIIINYWWIILISFIVISISIQICYRLLKINIIARKLRNLDTEEMAILGLLVDLQRKAFDKEEISLEEYFRSKKQYQKKLRNIHVSRTKLRNKNIRLIGSESSLANLETETKETLNLLQKAQENYFEKNLISKDRYLLEKRSINIRLAEIEKAKMLIKIKLVKKHNKSNAKGDGK